MFSEHFSAKGDPLLLARHTSENKPKELSTNGRGNSSGSMSRKVGKNSEKSSESNNERKLIFGGDNSSITGFSQ